MAYCCMITFMLDLPDLPQSIPLGYSSRLVDISVNPRAAADSQGSDLLDDVL